MNIATNEYSEARRLLLKGAGWSPEVAGVVIALYQTVRAGVRAAVTEDVARVLGKPARSFRGFAEDYAGEWRA